MSLYQELGKNKVLFLFSVIIGAYLGVTMIVLANFVFGFPENGFSLGALWAQIISSPGSLFQSIVCVAAFTLLSIAIAYGFMASRAYKNVNYKLNTALENNRIRNEFVSMLLHHIRTPLTAIKWSLKDLSKAEDMSDKNQQTVVNIYEENERSLRAVDRLVSASQASLDRISYNFEVVSLKDLLDIIQHQVDMFFPRAKNKNIKLSTKLCHPSNALFRIDKDKVMTTIETILENAITYTPNDGIIKVTAEERENDLLISISDSGIGIPKENQEKVFSQFFRTGESRTINPSGFGIGLYLAKNFIDHHDGKIWFISKDKSGTAFHISLPKFHMPTKEMLEKI